MLKGQLDSHLERIKLDPNLYYIYIQNEQRFIFLIKDLNMKNKTI